MKKTAVSLEELGKSLKAIIRDASDPRLLAEYKDALELSAPGPSGSRFEGGSRGAIAYSDPVLAAFDDSKEAERIQLRSHYERWKSVTKDVAHQVNVAQAALGSAKRTLERAAGYKVFSSERPRETKDRHPVVNEDDLREAREAKQRRDAG